MPKAQYGDNPTALGPELSFPVVLLGSNPESNLIAEDVSSTSQDGSGDDVYRHSLLEHGSIRLLCLMPHENQHAPIHCRIVNYPLQKAGQGRHPYEALSYVWGSEDNPKSIYIHLDYDAPSPKRRRGCSRASSPTGNTRRLSVTSNLHTALSHLRDRLFERIVWVDAICINQQDEVEKGHQVQSMARVYANATSVVVWLGEATADSDQAIETLRTVAELDAELPAVKQLGRPLEKPSDNVEIDEATRQAIIALLERPWFQRIWVGFRC